MPRTYLFAGLGPKLLVMETRTSKSKLLTSFGLSELELIELQDQAIDLVLKVFNEPTDAHINAVQERLIWNAQHGLGIQGSIAIH